MGQDFLDELEAGENAARLDDKVPQEVIRWALERFGAERLAIATSLQASDMVILDMAWQLNPAVRAFTIDTGRLPAETYDLIDRVRDKYRIAIEVYYPDAAELEAFVRQEGINAFYRSAPLRQRCCAIRKVNPLRKALRGLDAWVTGLRRDQWASRQAICKVEIDHNHGGLLKVNPLADWGEQEVWAYLRAGDVPYSALYEKGYTSIGCAPCTRPTIDGEDPRAGRWWWEQSDKKECGIHSRREVIRI